MLSKARTYSLGYVETNYERDRETDWKEAGVMDKNFKIIRTDSLPYSAGAYYVRIQAMAVKHHIPLEAEFDAHDTPETKYIIIIDDVLPVATVRLYPIGDDGMMLGRIEVLPEYRHRGLGSMAVRVAEEWARELGCRKTVLESRVNKLEFYEKLGYMADEDVIIHGDTFTCVYMEKKL